MKFSLKFLVPLFFVLGAIACTDQADEVVATNELALADFESEVSRISGYDLTNSLNLLKDDDAYEGSVSFVALNGDLVLLKHGDAESPRVTRSYAMRAAGEPFSDGQFPGHIAHAQILRDATGDVLLLDVTNGKGYVFAITSRDHTNRFPNGVIPVSHALTTSSTSNRLPTTRSALEDQRAAFRTTAIELGIYNKLSSRDLEGGGSPGPDYVDCGCRHVLQSASDCDSGGGGSTSCSITLPDNEGGCSVSCAGGMYACCSDEIDGN